MVENVNNYASNAVILTKAFCKQNVNSKFKFSKWGHGYLYFLKMSYMISSKRKYILLFTVKKFKINFECPRFF